MLKSYFRKLAYPETYPIQKETLQRSAFKAFGSILAGSSLPDREAEKDQAPQDDHFLVEDPKKTTKSREPGFLCLRGTVNYILFASELQILLNLKGLTKGRANDFTPSQSPARVESGDRLLPDHPIPDLSLRGGGNGHDLVEIPSNLVQLNFHLP